MKTLFATLLILFTGCAHQYSPEELIVENLKAAQNEDADARWEFSSKAAQKKMLEKNTKEEILKKFKYEAFMYKLIKSWETEVLEQSEDRATVKLTYKMLDPHSNKIITDKTDVKLVKEEGNWRIED